MAPINQNFYQNQRRSGYYGSSHVARYYPSVRQFHCQFENEDFIKSARSTPHQNLSIHVHMPFYASHSERLQYQQALVAEINHRAALFHNHKVHQVHFEAATSDELEMAKVARLLALLKSRFRLTPKCEFSIEVNAGCLNEPFFDEMQALSLNRINIRLPKSAVTLSAITRIQNLIARHKWQGIIAIYLDCNHVICGSELLSEVVQEIARFKADRIRLEGVSAFYHRDIHPGALHSGTFYSGIAEKLTNALREYGYQQLCCDYFSRADDELTQVRKRRQLGRNFHDYSACREQDCLGLGLSSFSKVGHIYCQNFDSLTAYQDSIAKHKHAIEKGLKLSAEDQLRSYVIRELVCNLFVDKKEVEEIFEVKFNRHFSAELTLLEPWADKALLIDATGYLQIFEEARGLLMTICSYFDQYQQEQQVAMRSIDAHQS